MTAFSLTARDLSKAQARFLAFCVRRPQQPEQNCRTARRLVELGLVSWTKTTIGRGSTAVIVRQVELTAAGRDLFKAEV